MSSTCGMTLYGSGKWTPGSTGFARLQRRFGDRGSPYATDPHDIARYEEVARLAAEVAGQGCGLDDARRRPPDPEGRRAAARSCATARSCSCARWPTAAGRSRAAGPTSASRRARSAEREFREESGIPVRARRS